MKKEIQKREGLTDLEILVLESARRTDYGDCLEDPQWSFAVCDTANLRPANYRGVVSSLVKKGFIRIDDQEGKGAFKDMVFSFTDSGKMLFMNKEEYPLLGEVVDGDYKWEDLYFAFEKVHPQDWKAPINAIWFSSGDAEKDKHDLHKIKTAIVFFTGSLASVTKEKNGHYRIRAVGYYEAIGA